MSSPGEVSCPQDSHLCPSWVTRQAELYTSGCWKIQKNTQKLQSSEDSYLFLVIQKVLTTNTRVSTCEILSFWKLVINVAHNTGMATLSKSVQQEEYFLGNKVKILAFNWISMGQINEVTAPSQTSIRETWESGCINSTSIHGTGQQNEKSNLQFQSFIQLWHRKVDCCLDNASEQIMLVKCLHSNLITQCNKFAFYTNTVHPVRNGKLGGQTLMSNSSIPWILLKLKASRGECLPSPDSVCSPQSFFLFSRDLQNYVFKYSLSFYSNTA